MTQIPDDLSRAIHHTTISIPPTPMQLSDSTSPEDQLARAMIDANIDISNPPDIVFDEKMHRFPVDTDKRGKKSGWYVAFGGDIPAWNFGNWKLHSDGEGINGHVTVNREWTDIERENYRKQQELIKQKKAAEREKRAKLAIAARNQALEIWNVATPATSAHDYIAKKKIQAYDLRVTTAKIQRLDGGKELNLKDALIIPYSDSKGITTLQFITPTGDKFFLPCGSLDNAKYLFKGTNDQKRVYVVEGWATGASVHEATGNDVIVAINTGGLKKLAPSIRASYDATTEIIFVADNDDPAKGATQGAGEIAALEAALTIGAKVILIPRINGNKADANDYAAFYGVDKLKELLAPSEQTSVSNNPAVLTGDYSGFAFNMDGKGSVTPISSLLPAIGASNAATPMETPATQGIPSASPAIPQSLKTASNTASADSTQSEQIQPRRIQLLNLQEYCARMGSVKYLIKDLIQAGGLNMIFGESGSGKSFIALNMAMAIADSKLKTWFNGPKLKHGPVCYLAGEGHEGLAKRAMANVQHGLNPSNFYLFDMGAHLDEPNEIKAIAQAMNEKLTEKPALIVIDTLHGSMNGNENDAQDTRKVLDGIAKLKQWFGCAVLLVHHTGLNPEAKDRARGSSAWFGAMDSVLQVQRLGDGTLKLIQTKAKDTEKRDNGFYFKLKQIPVEDFIDDDGQTETTCIVTTGTRPIEDKYKLSDAQLEAVKALKVAMSEHSQKDGDGNFFITLKEFKEAHQNAYIAAGKSDNPSTLKSTFSLRLKELKAKRVVENTGPKDTCIRFTNEYCQDNMLYIEFEYDYKARQTQSQTAINQKV